MKNVREFIWPAIGLLAVVVSGWLLYHELRGLSFSLLWASLTSIPPHRYALAALATLFAYAALAWYDRIALLHLGVNHISWFFVSVTSFTTYALSHNIGASVFSGALVRYRAYSSKGLSAPQIAVLVALCSFTFGLGTILLSGLVLTIDPTLLQRLEGPAAGGADQPHHGPGDRPRDAGLRGALRVGSAAPHAPARDPQVQARVSAPAVMVRQLIAAPLSCSAPPASSISRCRRPGAELHRRARGVPGLVLGGAREPCARAGSGVFELVFLTAMPDIPKTDVLAALIIFRLFYLLIPVRASIGVVLLFERARLAQAWRDRMNAPTPPIPPAPLT
jgi:hypothetical protein